MKERLTPGDAVEDISLQYASNYGGEALGADFFTSFNAYGVAIMLARGNRNLSSEMARDNLISHLQYHELPNVERVVTIFADAVHEKLNAWRGANQAATHGK